jgi:hypothetical protein
VLQLHAQLLALAHPSVQRSDNPELHLGVSGFEQYSFLARLETAIATNLLIRIERHEIAAERHARDELPVLRPVQHLAQL